MIPLVNKAIIRGIPPINVDRHRLGILVGAPKEDLSTIHRPSKGTVPEASEAFEMILRTPEFEDPVMRETQLLIHLREQVTGKFRHIIGNLVEAHHDPPKIRSSFLWVYEKKLGMYLQEHAKLHQDILDRIPASEFEMQEEL